MKKILIGLILLTAASGYSQAINRGKLLFESHCSRCHGNDGTKGKWGAKNLTLSTLNDQEVVTIISTGKRVMPSWKYTLTEEEIKSVKEYIKTLRN